MPTMTLDSVTAWERSMRASGRSTTTIVARVTQVRAIARDVGVAPESLSAEQVEAWFDRPMPAKTRSTYRGHVRAWSAYLMGQGMRTDDLAARLPVVRVPKSLPRPVSTELVRAMLALPLRRRARAMILLAALEGLRVHEIAKIRGDDLDLFEHTLRVVGKGGVDRILPLHPAVETEAKSWPRVGYWFPSYARPGHPIRPHAVSRTISRSIRKCQSTSTPHCLRHWFGTQLVRGGADILTTQQLMRHASPATTMIYVELAADSGSHAMSHLPEVA